MWQKVKFDTVNFSAFYFANLWVCFVSFFFLNDYILQLGAQVTNIAQKDLNVKSDGTTVYYWSLLFVYFCVVFAVMMAVMKTLHIHLPDNNVQGMETFITFVLIIGFFFYTFHKTFILAGMPDGTPPFIVNLIMGSKGRYLTGVLTTTNSSVVWQNLSDPLWCFGPLGFMLYRAKTDQH
jgi:hypothetical protein